MSKTATKNDNQTNEHADERTIVYDIKDLEVHFPVKQSLRERLKKGSQEKFVKAVDGISLTIKQGQTIGIAGESGCGKSTLAKTMVKLEEPTAGTVTFKGKQIDELKGEDYKAFRRQAQMVFQDPYESLNPRFTVRQTLEESLIIHEKKTKEERTKILLDVLTKVGLRPAENFIDRFPHELSGGQRQRVAIARALVIPPTFLVADEPVSMLDVSIRASVLNLLRDLVEELNLASVYISHDLSLIRYVCDDTAIMYLGRIVEYGHTEDIIKDPLHPYSKALLDAVPSPNPSEAGINVTLEDEAPNPIDLPKGCRFHPRCPVAMDICRSVEPHPNEVDGRMVECHLFNETNSEA